MGCVCSDGLTMAGLPMAQIEFVIPGQLCYDRPSDKFLSFLSKHYGLHDFVPQPNSFVVFKAFGLGLLELDSKGRPKPPLAHDPANPRRVQRSPSRNQRTEGLLKAYHHITKANEQTKGKPAAAAATATGPFGAVGGMGGAIMPFGADADHHNGNGEADRKDETSQAVQPVHGKDDHSQQGQESGGESSDEVDAMGHQTRRGHHRKHHGHHRHRRNNSILDGQEKTHQQQQQQQQQQQSAQQASEFGESMALDDPRVNRAGLQGYSYGMQGDSSRRPNSRLDYGRLFGGNYGSMSSSQRGLASQAKSPSRSGQPDSGTFDNEDIFASPAKPSTPVAAVPARRYRDSVPIDPVEGPINWSAMTGSSTVPITVAKCGINPDLAFQEAERKARIRRLMQTDKLPHVAQAQMGSQQQAPTFPGGGQGGQGASLTAASRLMANVSSMQGATGPGAGNGHYASNSSSTVQGGLAYGSGNGNGGRHGMFHVDAMSSTTTKLPGVALISGGLGPLMERGPYSHIQRDMGNSVAGVHRGSMMRNMSLRPSAHEHDGRIGLAPHIGLSLDGNVAKQGAGH
ncbi:hypothetical protein BC831DRAFT_57315 [Entophlyctis helioformis]|nr:hypothetical protein BC831DRAFT_57315 [Entophlyctis helioformis]